MLSLGTLWEAAFGGVPDFPSMISVCQGQDCPRQHLLAIWTFFVHLGHFFFLDVGLRLDVKWAEVAKFFGPIIAPQNPDVQLLWRGGGF